MKEAQDFMTISKDMRVVADNDNHITRDEMELIRNTNPRNTNLGPGVTPLGLDTFSLIRTNKIMQKNSIGSDARLAGELNIVKQ